MLEPEDHRLLEVWEADDERVVMYYPPWRRVIICTIASRQTFVIPEELVKKKPGRKKKAAKEEETTQATIPTYPTEEAVATDWNGKRFEPVPGHGRDGFMRPEFKVD